ncbi:uncharacterized protein LOC106077993 isoform X2 [Biomphalaria glabrata]|nr:uncharacterized protein LOC106077993 isoform X2 [Biomphalaria glabrata]XP_055873322.1 uncharacterized protein LOC106077993 isoform X2 [Biomphalaria glabrata]
MGKSLFHFIIFTTIITTSLAAFDSDFCNAKMSPYYKAPTEMNPSPPVLFFDNFFVLIESKFLDTKIVETTESYYSQQGEKAYSRVLNKATPLQIWIDANRDEVTFVPDTAQGQACVDSILEISPIYSLYKIYPDPNKEHFDMNTPAAVFGWDIISQKNVSYQGSNSSRGIPTDLWYTCEYSPFNDTTTFTEWQIADPSNLVLPSIVHDNSQAPTYVLPISSKVTYKDKSDPRNPVERVMQMDFTHFSKIQTTDRHFLIPPNMICANSPSSQIPLPTMPNYFRFRGEQVLVESPNPAALTYTIEEYSHDLGLFIQDFISVPIPYSLNDKSYSRLVTDFNSGLTYSLDLQSGSCLVNPVDAGNVGAYPLAGGFVQMRDSSQFFDLDSTNYTYLGQNFVEGRGIMCDVWSAYFSSYTPDKMPNTLYTWYFAAASWMQAQGYQQKNPIPVMLELTSNNRVIQFHFFEYSTSPSTARPDLSTCYAQDDTMNIQLFVFKARYDQVYKANPIGFRSGFVKSVTAMTSLKSGLRIADLDFQPAPNNEIQIQFKLLEKPLMKGDVQNTYDPAPNTQIFNELSDKINSGVFSFDVQNPPSESPGKQTVYVRPNSITQLSDADVMTFTITTDTRNTDAHSKLSSSSSSAGYSAGSMAGIGIGMLIAGLLIGVLAIFLVKRFRGGNDGSGISMQKMENE